MIYKSLRIKIKPTHIIWSTIIFILLMFIIVITVIFVNKNEKFTNTNRQITFSKAYIKIISNVGDNPPPLYIIYDSDTKQKYDKSAINKKANLGYTKIYIPATKPGTSPVEIKYTPLNFYITEVAYDQVVGVNVGYKGYLLEADGSPMNTEKISGYNGEANYSVNNVQYKAQGRGSDVLLSQCVINV